jgi:hypothetical protein
MTILKTNLVDRVNGTLRRLYTIDQLDTKITHALLDLSKADNFLRITASIDTVTDKSYYNLPSDFKDELLIEVLDHFPLEYELPNKFRVNLESANSSTPEKYTWFGDYFYVRPKPSSIMTLTLDYACYHASDPDNITFKDFYEEALTDRLIWYVAKSLNLYDVAKEHNNMYINELKILSNNLQRRLPQIMDRDTLIAANTLTSQEKTVGA